MQPNMQDIQGQIMPGTRFNDLNTEKIFKFIKDENHKGLIQHLKTCRNSLDLMIMKDYLKSSGVTGAKGSRGSTSGARKSLRRKAKKR